MAVPWKPVTWRDCPMVSPCLHCFDTPCTQGKCQKLWDFIAARGDWVMAENRKLQEKYGFNKAEQIMLDCKVKDGPHGCRDCRVRGCYVGNRH